MGRGKAGESGGFAAALSCSVYVETQVIPNVAKWSEESRLSRTQVAPIKYFPPAMFIPDKEAVNRCFLK